MTACCLLIEQTVEFPRGQAQKGNQISLHKFGGKCGLCYKLGVDNAEGNLVWVNGPFPAGGYHDITIFCNSLQHFLDPFECVDADDRYISEGPYHIKCPACATNPEEKEWMQGCVHARHDW
jgi:hypothetical protein